METVPYQPAPPANQPLDSATMRVFLDKLAETANVTLAAREAGYSPSTFYAHRKVNPALAVAWDEAEAIGVRALEAEATRRAFQGWTEPIYQKGVKVGAIRKYSDSLLMFLLKAHDRKYRLGSINEVSGPNGGPIQFQHEHKVALSKDELLSIAAGKPLVPQVMQN
jgi:hypothetical protein